MADLLVWGVDKPGHKTNAWEFDLELRTLTYKNGYWVDLDRCKSSAEVLDWIIQVSEKTWCSDRVIADLVRSLDAYLEPQANLCSGGINKEIDDVREVIRNCIESRWPDAVLNLKKPDEPAKPEVIGPIYFDGEDSP